MSPGTNSGKMAMPVTVIDEEMTHSSLSATFRRRRPGPESELVDWFLDTWPVKAPRGCRITVFREPRLESGFPDLVLVIWNVKAARRWNPLRASLTRQHIRLMQFILKAGSVSHQSLTDMFSKKISKYLSRLEEAEMVRKTGETWAALNLSESFAARNIVAIEAKMSEWTVALDQASLNTWFASTSFVLVPRMPKRSGFLQSAVSRGVGIWAQADTRKPKAIPNTGTLPVSYASWQFNEWACQHAWDSNELHPGTAR